ncbi:BON domain-containing protein [Simiduia curdlanivorans]|uniref:BON domain-containing protein n=1 Tax=Simiduia curdlanivorans TaxID=1492769 RepID=A0ABV8V5Q8_9GAMM|nr:BON domain-containing protein [Simiduia curdlanivorans]MDN3638565.1 BON domain-containing protein [Simiduia curdlanivorans]
MNYPKAKFLASAFLLAASAHTLADNESDWKNQSINDAWLDGKSEATLLLSPNLNNFTIDTLVKNGEVTLRGNVDSEIHKHLAEELVLSVEGVTSVNNQLKVAPDTYATDAILDEMQNTKTESLVKARLLMDTEVSGTSIEVEVNQGAVILSGTVSSSAERELAQAIAENTSDVEKVINNLQIAS